MRILVLCPSSDLAGVGIGIKRAFDHYSGSHTVRQVRHWARSYAYPTDADWAERHRLTAWAELVHVMERPAYLPPGKRTVLHQHGDYFRRNRDAVLAAQRRAGAVGIVSTLDLWLAAPDELEWLPSPCDIDRLATYRRPSPVLTVAHAPTDRVSKSTGPFLAACERLAREIELRVVLIEGATWQECLLLKGTADIYFDQVLTGYGQNAVEAMAMGIPVVAGIDPAEATQRGWPITSGTVDEMLRRFGGSLPFTTADEGTIYEALRHLADPANRQAAARRGLEHVHRFHAEPAVVERLEAIYRRA